MQKFKNFLSSLTPQNYQNLTSRQSCDLIHHLLNSAGLYEWINCTKGLKVAAWEIYDERTGLIYPELRWEY